MEINNKNININELLNSFKCESKLTKANSYIDLTEEQIKILEICNINYQKASSLKELIYIINDYLTEFDNEDLEFLLEEISERDYYENTYK